MLINPRIVSLKAYITPRIMSLTKRHNHSYKNVLTWTLKIISSNAYYP